MNSSLLEFSLAGGADINSEWFDISKAESASLQVGSLSANLTGTLSLEATNDPDLGPNDVPDSSRAFAKASVTPDSEIWDLTFFGYKFVRVKWVYTSGAGTLLGNLNSKG